MKVRSLVSVFTVIFVGVMIPSISGQKGSAIDQLSVERVDDDRMGGGEDTLTEGRRLFEQETFGGNGRTCLTCHSRKTGTVSPQDARARFKDDPHDPLFIHDGSDDGLGNGVKRMLADATIIMPADWDHLLFPRALSLEP